MLEPGLPLVTMIATNVIMAIASVLQASVGIGLALLAVPLLALVDSRLVPGPLLLAGSLLALMVLGDPFFAPYFARIAALAGQYRLPSIGPEREAAEAGYLMGYGTNRKVVRQRIAAYVDKILKGATPAELPVEQPTKFELVINLKTAQALGLTLSPQFLFRADEVVR